MSDNISEIILEELRELRKDLTPRVVKIEQWQANVEGKATMFGVLVTALTGFIAWITNHR